MFQSYGYIQRRHGKTGTDRAYHLNQLVQEYKNTEKLEAKQQVLANLANFAYDPINYNTLWDLKAVDLFLEALLNQDPLLEEFGMGGLANICLEPRHRDHIMSNETHRKNITKCLDNSKSINLVANTMSTLMQLITAENYIIILTVDLEQRLMRIKDYVQRKQTSTMALVFLVDYYHHHT